MQRMIPLLLLLTSMVSLAAAEIPFNEDEIKRMFLTQPVGSIVCDQSTNKAYGISYMSEEKYFISIDLDTGEMKRLRKFPMDVKMVKGSAAKGKKNKRYLFIGKRNAEKYLYVLAIATGETLYKHKLEDPLNLFEYDEGAGKIYALSRVKGNYCFNEYNVNSGKISIIRKLPHLLRIKGYMRKIDTKKREFLFEGVLDDSGKDSLLAINLKNGEMRTIQADKVHIDDYRVHIFTKGQTMKTIYTAGVMNCAAVAGYCNCSRVAFLAHFSPNFRKIEETLGNIEEEIKKKGGTGFAGMTIRVVGGRMNKEGSYENVLKIYRELNETYGVEYKGDAVYHMGKSYNIIINLGKIDIF